MQVLSRRRPAARHWCSTRISGRSPTIRSRCGRGRRPSRRCSSTGSNVVSSYDKRGPLALVRDAPAQRRRAQEYIAQDRSPAFTRFNVFLRDGFSCQYCGARRGPDLRSRDAPLARRAHDLGEHRHRLRPLQSRQGRPDARAKRPCVHTATRAGRRCTSSRTAAADSPPTTCTKAGWTTSIGTSNWRRRLSARHEKDRGRCCDA